MQTGNQAALQQAIALLRRAANTAPASDPRRADYLSNLGGALYVLFGETGQLPDITEANRAAYLSSAGIALKARPDRSGRVSARRACGYPCRPS